MHAFKHLYKYSDTYFVYSFQDLHFSYKKTHYSLFLFFLLRSYSTSVSCIFYTYKTTFEQTSNVIFLTITVDNRQMDMYIFKLSKVESTKFI